MNIYNEIAREIKSSTNKSINKVTSSLGLDLGIITSSGLKLDNFKYEIQDYMMLDHLRLDEIKSGDRVLVALLGNEFVVIGRVV